MTSKKIFLDSSVLYAFIDRADTNHNQALKIIEQLSLQGVYLYTSIQAIQETYAAISQHLGAALSVEFLSTILESNIEILQPQKSDLSSALKIIKANRDKSINLRETLTATLMQKKGIITILTFTYWPNILGSKSYLSQF